jgi:hypothetical protein
MRLRWADKIPLACFALITAFLFGLTAPAGAGLHDPASWDQFIKMESTFFGFTLVQWIELRVVDWRFLRSSAPTRGR